MADTLIDENTYIPTGKPVIAGTRVPMHILMERLEAGG